MLSSARRASYLLDRDESLRNLQPAGRPRCNVKETGATGDGYTLDTMVRGQLSSPQKEGGIGALEGRGRREGEGWGLFLSTSSPCSLSASRA